MTPRRRARPADRRARSEVVPSPLVRLPPIETLVALAATAAAIVLLVTFATHATALWRDEISSVNTQTAATLGEMWQRAEFESFPPLWMLLLRGWIDRFGTTDASLRVFGLFGPAALIASVWFAVGRLGRCAPALTLALLVVNPEIMRWAATVRPWGFGTALAITAIPLLWEASQAPSRLRIALAAVVAALSVACLFQNAVFLAAAVLGCLVSAPRPWRWRQALIPIGIGAFAALTLLPSLDLIERRAAWNALGAATVSIGDVSLRLWEVVTVSGPVAAIGWVGLVVIAIVVSMAALFKRSPDNGHDPVAAVSLVVVLVLSIAGILGLYVALGYPTQPWYFIGVLAVTAVTAESALGRLRPVRRSR